MSKKTDFVKSIHGMNEQDLKARMEEDKQRLKKTTVCSCHLSAGEPDDHPRIAQGYCTFAN